MGASRRHLLLHRRRKLTNLLQTEKKRRLNWSRTWEMSLPELQPLLWMTSLMTIRMTQKSRLEEQARQQEEDERLRKEEKERRRAERKAQREAEGGDDKKGKKKKK